VPDPTAYLSRLVLMLLAGCTVVLVWQSRTLYVIIGDLSARLGPAESDATDALRRRAVFVAIASITGMVTTGLLLAIRRRRVEMVSRLDTELAAESVRKAEDRGRQAVEAERHKELVRHDQLLNELVASASISLFGLDVEGNFTMAKGPVIDRQRVRARSLNGSSVHEAYAHRPEILRDVKAALAGETVRSNVDFGNGEVYAGALVPTHSLEDADEITGVVGIYADTSKRVQLEKQLRHQAEHDALTGLMNRAAFDEHLRQLIAFDEEHSCLLVLDIDGFKEVNDGRGHAVGDRALRAVAARMRACVRSTDVVARLGGDEFGVIVTTSNEYQIDAIANRLLLAVATPIDDATGLIGLTASIGTVGPGFGGRDSTAVLRDADLAMYEAKRGGKNRIVEFRPTIADQFMERITIKEELDVAIANDELRVFYQPLWDVETERPIGTEALVRWQHPTRGLLGPGEFIPIAEETGQVAAIDEWVMHTACRQTQLWRTSGLPALADLWVSVNLSSTDFVHSKVSDTVASALASSHLDPSGLVVEITETAVMENIDRTLDELAKVSELGVTVALDDFGAGHSSFSQLHRLDVDLLKVDRMFVTDGTDESHVSMAQTIVGLGKLLGLQVVAEGVETDAELRTMQAVGCDVIQGFLLARPMDYESCTELFSRQPQGFASAMPAAPAVSG